MRSDIFLACPVAQLFHVIITASDFFSNICSQKIERAKEGLDYPRRFCGEKVWWW